MTLTINGESRTFTEPLILTALLADLGLSDKPVVVELNMEAIAPSEFGGCQLAEGDQVEIIMIAAGG
jgi:thiamine biosynthesis protein ThiS